MEGADGSAWEGNLAISPASATLALGGSLSLGVKGGDGDYTFTVLGAGSFDEAAMLYTAPTAVGTERLRVTDGAGATAEAVLWIKTTTSPDYRIAPAPVFPEAGAGGEAFSGSFSVENIADEPGSEAIAWAVYVSRDAVLDSLDLLAADGTLDALGASSVSDSVAFSGTWPAAASDYRLIISLVAADDADASNDSSVSPAIAISGAPRPDYDIVSIGAPTLGLCSDDFSGTLVIDNVGEGPGSAPATWTVYLSTDEEYDEADSAIDSGLVTAGLVALTGTDTIGFSGSLPADPGTYYFIATVSAFDDTVEANNALSSAPIIVSGPDYAVTAVPAPTGSIAGQALSGLFTIRNDGLGAGLSDISWEVYASQDASLGVGDTLISLGAASALASGAADSQSYSGVWPSAAGTYYLIVRVHAIDDGNAANNSAASIALSITN
jgi:hypothetical protein